MVFLPSLILFFPSQLVPEYTNKRSFLIDDSVVKLSLWDTTGHERYEHLNARFISGSQAFIIVFDLTSLESFIKAKNKIIEINEKFDEKILILVGNKCDMVDNICISDEDAQAVVKQFNAEYFEASALTGHNIADIFSTAITLMKERNLLNITQSSPTESPELLRGSPKGSPNGSLKESIKS